MKPESGSAVACALSIIIPTWNSGSHIARCLEHLLNQGEKDFEVILVDNGSADYQPGRITIAYPGLVIREFALPENRGFATACNLGARHARGDWLAFLNADAFPEPGWLAAFRSGLRHFPAAGAFSSLVLNDADPSVIDSAGDGCSVNGFAWKRLCNFPLEAAPAVPQRVFSASGSAAFYRRDVFLELGGFAEDFFAYCEDVDLGFRLNLLGYACYLLPQARVRHVGSASTARLSPFVLYHAHRNIVWCFVRNMPAWAFWLFLPNHVVANLLYLLKYALTGQGRPVWRAKRDALQGLGRMLKKRRFIQASRRASVKEVIGLMNRNLITPYLRQLLLRRHLRKRQNM